MDKDVVCISNGLLPSLKRNEILLFAMTWMDLECIMLSEINQLEKDKYLVISLICGIKKKTETPRNRELISSY